MIGVVAGGVYGGLTGASEEEALTFADAVTQNIKDNEAQQAQIEAQKRQEATLLSKLPSEWKHEGSDLFQDDNGNWNYVHPDQQTWYKHVNNGWIDPNAGTEVTAAPAPTKRPALTSTTGKIKVIKSSKADKAKLDQRLKGRMWPNADQTIWYLEDRNRTMFVMTDDTFVPMRR